MTILVLVVALQASPTGQCFLSVSNKVFTVFYQPSRLPLCLAQGEVALSIADDAWKVAFYISFDSGEFSPRLPLPYPAY